MHGYLRGGSNEIFALQAAFRDSQVFVLLTESEFSDEFTEGTGNKTLTLVIKRKFVYKNKQMRVRT